MQQPAIILAAGRGARLGALTAATPKALLRLGPATLLERRLDSLARVLPGTTAHVVTGYCAEAFAPYGARPGVVLHPFEEAALANNIVSLLLALETVGTEAGFYLFNSDVVCDDAVHVQTSLGSSATYPLSDLKWVSATDECLLASFGHGRYVYVPRRCLSENRYRDLIRFLEDQR